MSTTISTMATSAPHRQSRSSASLALASTNIAASAVLVGRVDEHLHLILAEDRGVARQRKLLELRAALGRERRDLDAGLLELLVRGLVAVLDPGAVGGRGLGDALVEGLAVLLRELLVPLLRHHRDAQRQRDAGFAVVLDDAAVAEQERHERR